MILTQEEKRKVNRIVNSNVMVASLKVIHENMEYFRSEYKGNQKNVFNRIIKNCEILFDPTKMSDLELKEIETVSDALIDSEYNIREQYMKHVSIQILESRNNE